MSNIQTIHELANEHHEEEMDSWYYGPCDQVSEIAQKFNSQKWDQFIQSTQIDKPDMWRVFLAHSFIDEVYFGKGQEFIIEQALNCKSNSNRELIIQYMDNFDWSIVQTNYRVRILRKLKELIGLYPIRYRDIVNAIEQQTL